MLALRTSRSTFAPLAFLVCVGATFRPLGAGDPAPASGPAPVFVTEGWDPWLSPGNRHLAFQRSERDTRTRDRWGQPVQHAVLHVHDLTTGVERRAERTGRVTGWIGDDAVVLHDGGRVDVRGVGGATTMPTTPEGVFTPGTARSRDGRRVAYTVRGFTLQDHSPAPPEGREHTIHLVEQGQPPRALDLGANVNMDDAAGLLAFSPDGRRLAFHIGFMEDGALPHPRVGVVDLESGKTTFVYKETYGSSAHDGAGRATGADAWGAWDGAGRRFAFVVAQGPGRHDVYSAAADGTDLRRHSRDGQWKSTPCLAPEGERLAWWNAGPAERDGAPAKGPHALRVLQLRTGAAVDVPVPGVGRGADLQWSADGKDLWFHWSGEVSGIYRVAAPAPLEVPAGTPIVDVGMSELEQLLDDLGSPDRYVVRRALERVAEHDDAHVTQAVLGVLDRLVHEGEPHDVWDLGQVLRQREAVAAVPLLLECLAARKAVAAVTRLLLDWGIEEAVPLWRSLDTAGVEDRATGLVALASFGDEQAWRQVAALLVKPSRDPRDRIVGDLAHVRDPRSVELLIPLVEDETFLYTSDRNYVLGDGAARCLQALTGQALGRDRAAWETWWKGVGGVLPERERSPR
jgi:hypothetical protein